MRNPAWWGHSWHGCACAVAMVLLGAHGVTVAAGAHLRKAGRGTGDRGSESPPHSPPQCPLVGTRPRGCPVTPYLLVRGQLAGCPSPLPAGGWPQERCPRWKPNSLLQHSRLLVPHSRTASGIKRDFSFKNRPLTLAAGPGEAQPVRQHPGACLHPGTGTDTGVGWRQRERGGALARPPLLSGEDNALPTVRAHPAKRHGTARHGTARCGSGAGGFAGGGDTVWHPQPCRERGCRDPDTSRHGTGQPGHTYPRPCAAGAGLSGARGLPSEGGSELGPQSVPLV